MKKYALFAAIVLLFTSCNDDILGIDEQQSDLDIYESDEVIRDTTKIKDWDQKGFRKRSEMKDFVN